MVRVPVGAGRLTVRGVGGVGVVEGAAGVAGVGDEELWWCLDASEGHKGRLIAR